MSIVPPPPIPSPQVQLNPQLFRNPFNANSEILIAAKAALRKVVPIVEEAAPDVPAAAATNVDDGNEHSYALVVAPQNPTM